MKNVQMCKLNNDGFYREIVISSVEHTHGRSVVLRKSFSSSHARIFIYFFTVDLMPFAMSMKYMARNEEFYHLMKFFIYRKLIFFPRNTFRGNQKDLKKYVINFKGKINRDRKHDTRSVC